MNWRFVHIPRTGGTSFRRTYGTGYPTRKEHPHTPASYFDGFKTISFVRNPYDRLVSIFGFMWRRDNITDASVQHFRKWVKGGIECDFISFAEEQWPMTTEQRKWIAPDTYTVKLEGWETGLQVIDAMTGLFHKPIQHANLSKRKADWREYYDDETAAIVLERYQGDFDEFQYAKEVA